MLYDMPLNSDLLVLDRGQFEAKRGIATQKSVLDFALWGGLCPGAPIGSMKWPRLAPSASRPSSAQRHCGISRVGSRHPSGGA